MTKLRRGYSELIEAFFSEIGYCPQHLHGATWKEDDGRQVMYEPDPPECSPTIARVAEALDAIVNEGAAPDEALQIERFRGRRKAAYTEPLAWRIDRWRKAGETWAVIEILANEWLQAAGYDFVLSEKRLITLYNESDAKRGVLGSLEPRDWAKDLG